MHILRRYIACNNGNFIFRKLIGIFIILSYVLTSAACTGKYVRLDIEEKHALLTLSGGVLGGLVDGHMGGFVLGAFFSDMVSLTYIQITYEDRLIYNREQSIRNNNKNHDNNHNNKNNNNHNNIKNDKFDKFDVKEKKVELNIEDSNIKVVNDKSGNYVEATIKYTLLSPKEDERLKVIDRRVLSFADKRIELDRRELLLDQGTYVSTIKFVLPKKLPKGYYSLITILSNDKNSKYAKLDIDII
jgi:hypothetical protein